MCSFLAPTEIYSEKEAYKVLRKHVFRDSHKVGGLGWRGAPDFVVYSLTELGQELGLGVGFYEVKMNGRELSDRQKSVITKLLNVAKVYIAWVHHDGIIDFYLVEEGGDEANNDKEH
ncbi:hypothetical protein KEJ32_05490 [Candidatus Bathyarchaeota archaeon]|nr:hypothetical protein [Candidatus Bathyarchaeota archaeon]